MTRVLVAEDEPLHRREVEDVLRRAGYEIQGVGSGQGAIEAGALFRPDVLVADWMLANHLHGLHVAEALRQIHPRLRTILVTGFASPDLGATALRVGVFDLLHKPLHPGRLLQALRRSLEAAPPGRGSASFVAVMLDEEGRILHRNPTLEGWLGGGTVPLTLRALLEGEGLSLERARQEWTEASLRGAGLPVLVRARSLREGRRHLLVLLSPEQGPGKASESIARPGGEGPYGPDFLVRALLDLGATGPLSSLVSGRVLAVAEDPDRRRRMVRRVEAGGLLCHSADQVRLALRLLRRDSDLELVLLDRPATPRGIDLILETLAGLRRLERRVRVMAVDPGREAAEAGVLEHYRRMGVKGVLPMGWGVLDLAQLLGDSM